MTVALQQVSILITPWIIILITDIRNFWAWPRTAVAAGRNDDNFFYSIQRTCEELLLANPTVKSGDYYIDPDGINVGDAPMNVFCNMSTGIIKLIP